MVAQRRNLLTRRDAQFVGLLAVFAGGLAALADVAPTGQPAIDTLIAASLAAAITWCAATAPWWALLTASGIVTVGALGGAIALIVAGAAALACAAWIGWTEANHAVLRAAIGGVVVQVALRLAWNPFFLAPTILAAVALGLVVWAGLRRRQRYVRVRAAWTVGAIGVLGLVAVGGFAVAAGQAGGAAREGYNSMLDGLEAMEDGDPFAAADALQQAADELDEAHAGLASVLTQPARLVPGLAQNRDATATVLGRAAVAADQASFALAGLDLDRLTVSDGRVDVAAFTELAPALDELDLAVSDLRDALDEAHSPWLVAPLQDRLGSVRRRADQVAHQASATAAAARIAPEMLGADGPRRYLLAFVNTAEARGQGGLMGNWSELTVDDGRIEVTQSGRSADLQTESLRDLQLDVPNDYIARYGNYGATRAADDGVLPKFWSNVTMPADMAAASSPMAQMYEQATGRHVDGVLIIDPDGLAALVDLVGSIEVPELDRSFDGDELRQFLLLDQYEIEEAEREDVLETLTAQAVAGLLSEELPPPQELAEALSDAALNGHITAWAADADEEQFLQLVGMDGLLPQPPSGMDALAVVSNNAGGNKIDNFLQRRIEYRPVVDQRTGDVAATLKVTLTNDAPTRGYTDYVVGNLAGAPRGTNRMLIDVYSRLDVVTATFDGQELDAFTSPELGYSVFRRLVDIAPGESAVLELELAGNVGPGSYALAYRPQSLPNDDILTVEAATGSGATLFDFSGTLHRRSVLDADGVRAWRAADAAD